MFEVVLRARRKKQLQLQKKLLNLNVELQQAQPMFSSASKTNRH